MSIHRCLANVFLQSWLILGTALTMVIIQLTCQALRGFSRTFLDIKMPVPPILQRAIFVIMSAVYPLVAKKALAALHCASSPGLEGTFLIGGPTVRKVTTARTRARGAHMVCGSNVWGRLSGLKRMEQRYLRRIVRSNVGAKSTGHPIDDLWPIEHPPRSCLCACLYTCLPPRLHTCLRSCLPHVYAHVSTHV